MSINSSSNSLPLGNTIAEIREGKHERKAIYPAIVGIFIIAAIGALYVTKITMDWHITHANNFSFLPNDLSYVVCGVVTLIAGIVSGKYFYDAYFYARGLKHGVRETLNRNQFRDLLNTSLKEATRKCYDNLKQGKRDYPQYGTYLQVGANSLGEADNTRVKAFAIMAGYQEELCNWWHAQEEQNAIREALKNPEEYLRSSHMSYKDIARIQIEINALKKIASQQVPTRALKGEEAEILKLQTQVNDATEQLNLKMPEQDTLLDKYITPLKDRQSQAETNMTSYESQWPNLLDVVAPVGRTERQ